MAGDGIVVVIEIADGASKPYCDNKGVYWVFFGLCILLKYMHFLS